MRTVLCFFAALAMSASASGREPDAIIRIENATTSALAAPCMPVVVEPIKLVPVGTGAASTPTPTPSTTPTPTPAPKPDSGAPWWVWPVLILAVLGFVAWRNSQAQAERERRARDAAERAAQEARERREQQEAEERARERESLLKAAAIAAWEREHGVMNDAERRAFETRWALASHDGQIQSPPARLDVLVDSASAVVRPAEILGGRRVERRVVQQETPATTPPVPAPITPPAPNPPAPQPRNEPRPNEPERRPIGEGKLAGLRGREQACGRTDPVADQHLCGLLHVRSLEEPVTRDDLNNAFTVLDQEMASRGLSDYREWRRQQDAAQTATVATTAPVQAPAAPTQPAADQAKAEPAEPPKPTGDKPEGEGGAAPATVTGEGAEEPKP